MKNLAFTWILIFACSSVNAQSFELIWDDNEVYEKESFTADLTSYNEDNYWFILGKGFNTNRMTMKEAYKMNFLEKRYRSDFTTFPYLINLSIDQKLIKKIELSSPSKENEFDEMLFLKDKSFIFYRDEDSKNSPNKYGVNVIDNQTGTASWTNYYTLEDETLSKNNRSKSFRSTDSTKAFMLFQKIALKVSYDKDPTKKIAGILLDNNGKALWTMQFELDGIKESRCNIEEALVLPNGEVYFILKNFLDGETTATLSGPIRDYNDKAKMPDKTYRVNYETLLYKISSDGKSMKKISLNNIIYASHYLFYNNLKNTLGFIGCTHDNKDLPNGLEYSEIDETGKTIKYSKTVFPDSYISNINKYLASIDKYSGGSDKHDDRAVRFINHIPMSGDIHICADFITAAHVVGANSFSRYIFGGDIYFIKIDATGNINIYNKIDRLFSIDESFADKIDYKPYPFLYKGQLFVLRNASNIEKEPEKILKGKLFPFRKDWSLLLHNVGAETITSTEILNTCGALKVVNTSYIYRASEDKFIFQYETGKCGNYGYSSAIRHSTLILK